MHAIRLDPRDHDAVIFDMDGVLTATARLHARAWKETFDAFLEARSADDGGDRTSFDQERDYRAHVDGVPRYEGVRRFLASRGIALEEGAPDDPPGRDTVHGLGNRKNRRFLALLREEGAERFEDAVELVERLRRAGIRVGVISASRNAERVLEAAGLADLFETRVDGVVRQEAGLAGKPAPDVFLEAARRLGARPERTAVLEDAVAGVEAGRAGGFATVIGVARSGGGERLARAGADAVVADLSAIEVRGAGGDDDPAQAREATGARRIDALPSALGRLDAVVARIGERRPAFFLDYDGTLSPIVDHPEEAELPEPVRALLARLGARYLVAVVSGRDLGDLRERVGLEQVVYAGSHGFELVGPDGEVDVHEPARRALPELDRAEARLADALAGEEGVELERKGFGLAVHFRRADPAREPAIRAEVERACREGSALRTTEGREVLELRPDLPWDKGRALERILERTGADEARTCPVYVGDDVTDEDAFRVVEARGVGVLVRGRQGETTRARYVLEDPGEVRRFLAALADRMDAPRAPTDAASGRG